MCTVCIHSEAAVSLFIYCINQPSLSILLFTTLSLSLSVFCWIIHQCYHVDLFLVTAVALCVRGVCVSGPRGAPHPVLGCNLCHWLEFDGWAAPHNTMSQGGECVYCADLQPRERGVCMCVTCEQQCSASPASASCHSEEPGGDSQGRSTEALTAATCHISQLRFGGNQFGTLIRSTTPTPGATERAQATGWLSFLPCKPPPSLS